ncbi:MAG: hypothetical protein ACXADY_25245 [Candidatus Hodarchaeales archaeon]
MSTDASFCWECGAELEKTPQSTWSKKDIIAIDFTKEGESLKRTLSIFDEIFADQPLLSTTNQELWDKKKTGYTDQKKRFLKGKISNEVFYSCLKRLKEYLQSVEQVIPLSASIQESILQEPIKTFSGLKLIDQKLISSDKEVKKWHEWFLRQTDLYQKSKMEKRIYSDRVKSYQQFLKGKNVELPINWGEFLTNLAETKWEVFTILRNEQEYRIREINGRELMNIIPGKKVFRIQSPDGTTMGKIKKLDVRGRKWDILGLSEENQGRVIIQSSGYRGKIETTLGTFNVRTTTKDVVTSTYGGYIVTTEFDVIDSNNNPFLTVTWIDYETKSKLKKEYRVNSQHLMNPFLIFAISVCLIRTCLGKKKFYNNTPPLEKGGLLGLFSERE